MPERAEIFVQHKQVSYFIQKTGPEDRRLRALWLDATSEEQAAAPLSSPARRGFVYRLPPGSTIRRGAKRSNTDSDAAGRAGIQRKKPQPTQVQSEGPGGYALYPYWLCDDLAKDTYVLIASHFSPISLLLEFRNAAMHPLYLDIRLLLHVSVQIFTSTEWQESICKVPGKQRGFKVALALDLGPFILAFLSHDLLFQIRWDNERERLPGSRVADVLHNWPQFLQGVATWIQQRRLHARSRDRPAFLAIHQADVFGGLGNYTLSEVFHRAGLQISLTERELFDNASRTARLCLAYREFALHAEHVLWPSMKRFLHGFKLAVERSHRLLYGKSLKVYGKEWTCVTARHGALLDEALNAARTRKRVDYDPFEPGLVFTSLTIERDNLGHLVFGQQEWHALRSSWGLQISDSRDALSQLYRPFLSAQRTHLRPGHYRDGLMGGEGNARRFATIMYRLSPSPGLLSSAGDDDSDSDEADDQSAAQKQHKKKKKVRTFQAWSIIPSALSRAVPAVQERMMQVPEAKRLMSTLAEKIKSTRTYTVGPLDFCGVARLERAQGRGKPILFLCNDDPSVPAFYRHRRQRTEERLKTHFKAALQVRQSRRWNTRKKKGPSHKRDPNSTRTRRSPTSDDQLAIREGLELIKDLPPRRRRT
ncbi:hypothetical protein FKP32DRAFT_1680469 [Trametes sanguinea]|nr:hypothetical protein FKP32DRAFT_1680469 [Trametes sanguinea]